ncbi:uncharacterized protein LOC113360789 [Papaver somniferum]|uniref:uncharacterized protein LOC113360789 n=1 Tax=Papaver somniferum TaxID=3469 RepID=UPI000E702250|nr:uncharacterized protein LOC113360789 [Papaver somniferum]
MVASMYEVGGDCLRWGFMPRQRYSQPISIEVTTISNLLSSNSIQEGVLDSRVWVGNVHGKYTVKDGIRSDEDEGEPNFPIDVVWSREYPYKINFFLWLLSHDRIMTADNLLRRGMNVSSLCCFCDEDDETSSHLFYECWRTRRIWDYFVEGCRFEWTYNSNVTINVKSWKFNWCDERLSQIWNNIPVAIWWCIWRERNARVFDNKKKTLVTLIRNVKLQAFFWAESNTKMLGLMANMVIALWDSLFRHL